MWGASTSPQGGAGRKDRVRAKPDFSSRIKTIGPFKMRARK